MSRYGARNRAGGDPLTIECYAEFVPKAFGNSFYGVPVESARLLVNDDLVGRYKKTSPWSSFGTILGFNEATGISLLSADQQGVDIFSIDGRRLDKPQRGVNIIKTKQGAIRKMMWK